jgi:hypothetical protein
MSRVLRLSYFPMCLISNCSELVELRKSSLTAHWSERLVIIHFYWLVAC